MLEQHLNFLDISPYSLSKVEKRERLENYLNELSRHHYAHCPEYARILDAFAKNPDDKMTLEEIPALPVRIFKEKEMLSVPKDQIVKVMTSSGTSGQKVSKIHLDKETTRAQSKCLTNIVKSYIGSKRLPMLILDTPMVKKDRTMFSARGAGIIGFSMFGRDVTYALNEEMNLDVEALERFMDRNDGEKIVLFGYTYMIWQYFLKELEKRNICLGIKDGMLFHTGGWKKLKAEQISEDMYRERLQKVCGNISVHNQYGMAEQLGSVFMECEHGNMHCSIFSDVIIRRAEDFSICYRGESGLIELMSVLPSSYPGHAILTEDLGICLGEDDCPCGRLGKYFKILGRVQNAEIRGCSDTYGR